MRTIGEILREMKEEHGSWLAVHMHIIETLEKEKLLDDEEE